MDTEVAVASKRDERRYAHRSIPEDVVERILDAGRLAGSSANRQARRFVVVDSEEARHRIAQAVYVANNVLGAALVVAVAGRSGFDVGRAAQNMMLVAWNEGVHSCPNGLSDQASVADLVGDETCFVIGFGYPVRPRDAERRTREEWSARANRLPLAERVTRV